MKNNSGKRASFLYLIATLFNKGIVFLTVPIFTKLLSTSDYGIVSTYNSWIDILTVLLSLALYMAIRTAFVDYEKKTDSFFNTIITFTLLFSSVIGLIVLLVCACIWKESIVLVVCAMLQGTASAMLMDYTQYLMMDFQYIRRSFYMATPNFIATVLSVVVIALVPMGDKYMGRIIPTMIVYVFFGSTILFKTYNKSKPTINKQYLSYGLRISLPLVLHGAALSILSQSDRTMITVLVGSSQTGIYSLVYNFGMIATVLTTAMDGIWLPWFMSKMKCERYDEINQRAVDYIKVMTCAMIGIILVGPEILKFLADKKYWAGLNIIPAIVLANYIIFVYNFYVNAEHYYKKTASITTNTIIAACCNIGLNFIFIPKYGYVAAAFTTVASYAIALLLHARCSRKLQKMLFPPTQFIKVGAVLLFGVLLYYMVIDYWIVRWILCVMIILVMIYKERKKILNYLRVKR